MNINWLLTGEGEPTTDNRQPATGSPDIITEKILQLLDSMSEDKRRDVLKYAEKEKLLEELLTERRKKDAA